MFDFNCPVNVQGYDPSLGIRQHQTISGVIAYCTSQNSLQGKFSVLSTWGQLFFMLGSKIEACKPLRYDLKGVSVIETTFSV